jgi:CRP-like cAMP-binding protein
VGTLSHYVDLTPAERAALSRFEETPEDVAAQDLIFDEGEPVDEIAVLQDGWLFASTLMSDGRRQILRFYFPGDLVGHSSIAFRASTHQIRAVSNARLCRVSRRNFGKLIDQHPRLGALFYVIAAVENAELSDRLRAIGRADGQARIAGLFLSIASRLRINHGRDAMQFNMPITQMEIADAVGLTNIHVSRLMKAMAADGLIARARSDVRLIDEAQLRRIAQYEDRYARIDTSWFPPSRD